MRLMGPETSLQNAQETLEEIAGHRGSKAVAAQEFDPNICTFTHDPRNRAVLVASSGQPLLRKTAFEAGGLKVRLFANDSFLRAMLLHDLRAEPFSLNRSDKIQLLKPAGEILLGGRSYSVSTRSGTAPVPHSGIFDNAAFLRLLEAANLGKEESLHVYGNGLALYLFLPSAERADTIIETGEGFLSQLPAGPQKPDLRGLPVNFSPLLPLLQAWGILDDEEREERRANVPRPALQAMIDQVKPYLPAIDSYLRQFGGAPLTEAAVTLGALAEFVVETELYLKH
jgi:hypothetical protein